MDIRQVKENKLKTILQFSIPSIIAMLLQTITGLCCLPILLWCLEQYLECLSG